MAKKKPGNEKKSEGGRQIIVDNRKARREIEVLEDFEAGIELTGTEIKSIREKKVSLGEAYVRLDGRQCFLVGATISEYTNGSWTNHDPTRKRRLLLHKREIDKLRGGVELKGLTILPLQLYISERGWCKVKIGLGRGKKLHDKRQDMKNKDANREIARAMKQRLQ